MTALRMMPPLLRVAHGVAMLGIVLGLVFDAFGGQWMRWGTTITGAGFLPFGALILTNFRGEYAQLNARLRQEHRYEPPERLAPLESNTFRYGFGLVVLAVGMLFLVVGIEGGPGVTKPGGFF